MLHKKSHACVGLVWKQNISLEGDNSIIETSIKYQQNLLQTF